MRKSLMFAALFFLNVFVNVGAAEPSRPIINFRDVGEISNPADDKFNKHGRGSVGYLYRIAEKPVSNSEYAAFLNAVDRTGGKGLYVREMAITRAGEVGSYRYEAVAGKEELPVISVTYANAAEFCNWLSGGKVYEIIDEQSTDRNPANATGSEVFFIPTHDELYKGKYYQGDGKYGYASSPVAEMVSTRYRVWHRVAFGNARTPEEFIYCNNYTNNVTGKSEDNIRNKAVGFRVASLPRIHVVKKLESRHNVFADLVNGVNVNIRSFADKTAVLSWKIVDYWGKVFDNGNNKLALQKGLNNVKLGERKYPRGYFRITGTLSDGGAVIDEFDVPFAVMPQIAVKPAKDSPFGISMHMDRMYNLWGRVAPEEYEDLILNAGMAWVRTDYPWKSITGPLVDKGVNILSFFPFHYSYYRYDSPYENEKKESRWSKLNIAPELYSYADKVEKLILENPHVTYWEVGNEPHAWRVSPGDYAQQVKTAYKVAKAIRPETFVILGDSNHLHKSLIKIYHADKYADAVAIHTYGFLKPEADNYFEGVVSRVRELRRSLAENGDSNKPVWTTEIGGCGYWIHIFPGETAIERNRYQALDLPKKLAGSIGLGVSKVFYYEFAETEVGGTEGEFGIVTKDLLPKPAYVSYRVTAEQLDKKKFAGWLDLGDKKFSGLEFSGAAEKCYLLWREDKPVTLERRTRIVLPMVETNAPEELAVKATGGVVLTDVMGNSRKLEVVDGVVKIPLTEYPVFVKGDLQLKHKDVLKLKEIEPNTINDRNKIVLQIIPPIDQVQGYNDLHNMQLQTRMKLAREKDQTFTVRLFNLGTEEVSGKVYLLPPQSNSDLGWTVKNVYDKVTIKPESTRTVSFTVNIPKRPYIGESPYILKAVFESGDNIYYADILVQQMINRDVIKKGSVADTLGFYSDGKFVENFELVHKNSRGVKGLFGKSADKDIFEVQWDNPGNKFFEVAVKSNPVITGIIEAPKTVVLGFNSDKLANVQKVSIRLIDRDGEIFQYTGSGKYNNGKMSNVSFVLAPKKHAGNWGGNKNGIFDEPVRLKSFVIDYYSNKGTVKMVPPFLVLDK